jgi:hypothetical protein
MPKAPEYRVQKGHGLGRVTKAEQLRRQSSSDD